MISDDHNTNNMGGTDCGIPHDTDHKLRVAAYCRVSTDQDEQTDSFHNQVETFQKTIQDNPAWELAGIYTDEGISGTRADRRAGFLRMMNDCRAGKIDRILTKSISRFARNVVDSLSCIRELREMGVSVYFEEEHLLSTDHGAELIFTILSAMAEQESRNISENTKWGIRSRFRQGIYRDPVSLNLYGFIRDDARNVAIDNDEAVTVRFIYRSFLEGMIANKIARTLTEMGIHNRHGPEWTAGLVRSILTNEKYTGNVTLQKSYAKDFISHRRTTNHGEIRQYHIREAHPAIIDRQQWEAVQQEITRRKQLADPFGHPVTMSSANPYTGKIFYQEGCHALLSHSSYRNGGTWKCRWCRGHYQPVCRNPDWIACQRHDFPDSPDSSPSDGVNIPQQSPVSDLLPCCKPYSVNNSVIRRFFLTAWNAMVDSDLPRRRDQWTQTVNNTDGDPLAKVRAQQMLDLTSNGADSYLSEDIPEIVRMVLDRIGVKNLRQATITFLDGTVLQADLGTDWELPASTAGKQ